MRGARPPRLFETLLSMMAPPEDRRFLLSDLREEFVRRESEENPLSARRWYRRQVTTSLLPLLARRFTSIAGSGGSVGWRSDLVNGMRMVRRSPGFSLLVIGIMAVGIGGTTAVYSVAKAVLIEPLPFEAPDRLIVVRTRDAVDPSRLRGVSGPDYFDYVERMTTLSGLFGYEVVSETLSDNDGPAARITVAAIGHSGFRVLGRSPALGRGFTADENSPEGERVVVLSDRLWRDRFGGSREAVGASLILDGRPHTVVGVMPVSFEFPSAETDLWRPLRIGPNSWRRGAPILSTVGRMMPGIGFDAVGAEFTAIANELAEEHPESNGDREAVVVPLDEALWGSSQLALLLLLGAVGVLLLLDCFNVANLMLARAASRREEFTLRTALGASRGRLIRQLAGESLILSLLGGAAGVGLAWAAVRTVVGLVPADVYRIQSVALDAGVVFFAVVASLLAGLLFGVVPALHASRATLRRGLVRGAGPRSRTDRFLGRGLIVGQVTLAMVLVVTAGLFGRSLDSLLRVDPGFEPSGLLSGRIDLPSSRYPTGMSRYPAWPEVLRFYERALEELRALPGITEVALGSYHPLQRGFLTQVTLEELAPGIDPESVVASPWSVTPGYFSTVGMEIQSGRGLDRTDRGDAPRVAVVNRAFLRRYVPNDNVLGMHVQVFGRSAEIVGVVSDVTSFGLGEPAPPTVYHAVQQAPVELLAVLVRTAGSPAAAAPAVRGAIRKVDPEVALYELLPLTAILKGITGTTRFSTWLLGSFAGMALLLAAVGIFGVLAESVEQRSREVGIRLALGARPRQVLLRVVTDALSVTALGLLVGTGLALVAGQLMEGFLFGVGGADLVTYLAAGSVLITASLIAAVRPATHAASADPASTLRGE